MAHTPKTIFINQDHDTYWTTIWRAFTRHKIGLLALTIVACFCLVAVYAPLLASSQPLVVVYKGAWYFPAFRNLFNTNLFTKPIDIFFNLCIITLPLFLLTFVCFRRRRLMQLGSLCALLSLQLIAFLFLLFSKPLDPTLSASLATKRHEALKDPRFLSSWPFELEHMTPYAQLNLILKAHLQRAQHERLSHYTGKEAIQLFPTLWQLHEEHLALLLQGFTPRFPLDKAGARKQTVLEKEAWLKREDKEIQFLLMPPFSHFHWEEDAGGNAALNQQVPWWHLTRINRKDLTAALIFGTRVSLVVGFLSCFLALLIGIPLGALSGFYGGTLDIVLSRFLEIWESMPTFFMLLLTVAFLQSKSIFLVITVISLFGWTQFTRYMRGEFFKQRNLPYVEACRAMGFSDRRIIFSHILKNAIPPILTLVPFAVMAAITTEAGLSFLGLGEEGSSSWGILMDEGRAAFPGEAYLLWPPALLLSLLLIAVALVGDALRDVFDPRMNQR